MNDSRLDLIVGQSFSPDKQQKQHEEYMTATLMQSLGGCDLACSYIEPYGWVPECGCSIHDIKRAVNVGE